MFQKQRFGPIFHLIMNCYNYFHTRPKSENKDTIISNSFKLFHDSYFFNQILRGLQIKSKLNQTLLKSEAFRSTEG